ncbi:uncharacterized protein LOC142929085 [Petromyzon marinus]|uniref:uncharacterized protein LOC142929085 n=1 Tax=Petromyzon marinus TaxID=7757 RepID=UPI003F701334
MEQERERATSAAKQECRPWQSAEELRAQSCTFKDKRRADSAHPTAERPAAAAKRERERRVERMAWKYLHFLSLLTSLHSVQGQTMQIPSTIQLILSFPTTHLDIVCAADQYQCADHTGCIPQRFYCDGTLDCTDHSDETPNCQCFSNQQRCANGTCLATKSFCDGVNDCGDYSDETNCTCSPNQFLCSNIGRCLDWIYVCDGDVDCSDGYDETGCEKECATSEFRCADRKHCIRGSLYCDGVTDCADQSDETPDCACREDQIRCRNGSCLGIASLCDGVNDCGDFTDESNCSCPANLYACNNSNNECLEWIYVCDGEADCSGGSDESDCERECARSEFRCADKKHCIRGSLYCDGTRVMKLQTVHAAQTKYVVAMGAAWE